MLSSPAEIKLQQKLLREEQLRLEEKRRMRQEAMQLQAELGMIDATVMSKPPPITGTRKQRKEYQRSILFPDPAISLIDSKGRTLFKNKSSMQRYFRRVISDLEWNENYQILSSLIDAHFIRINTDKDKPLPLEEQEECMAQIDYISEGVENL